MVHKKSYKNKVLEYFLLVGSCSIVASFFPSGFPLAIDGSLMSFWFLPAFFIIIRMAIMLDLENMHIIHPLMPRLFYVLANGVWSGLSLGSIFILNEWYRLPNLGEFEPLLIATSLSSAATLYASKELLRLSIESKEKFVINEVKN